MHKFRNCAQVKISKETTTKMAANVEQQNKASSENGNAVMDVKDTQNLLPHLESLERIIKLPVVNAAWDKSQDVYEKVKGRNRVFNWAFSAAEDCVSRAITTAAPIVSKFDGPIQYVDGQLVKGIETLEVKAPIIKETPQEIYNQAKNKVVDVVQPHIERVTKMKAASQQKASSLKDLAWNKANEVLATQYGQYCVSRVDATTKIAESLLEHYFPKNEGDIEEDSVPVAASDDPVLHTVQTVGRLKNKISRRLWCTVSRQMKQMRNSNVNDYLSSLIAALKLHQYINFINASMGTNVEQSTLTDCTTASAAPASSSSVNNSQQPKASSAATSSNHRNSTQGGGANKNKKPNPPATTSPKSPEY